MRKILLGLLLPLIMIAGDLPKDKHWAVGVHIAPLPSIGASYYWHEKALEFELTTAYNEKRVSRYYAGSEVEKSLKTSTSDLHLRKYSDGKIGGVYYSGFLRISHMDGMLRDDYRAAKLTKLALGVGIGYRSFFTIKNAFFYWSVGLNAGHYLLGKNDVYLHDGWFDIAHDDYANILNIDVLKFAYVF